MAASPIAVDSGPAHAQEKWTPQETQAADGAATSNGADVANGVSHPDDHPNAKPAGEGADFSRNSSAAPEGGSTAGSKQDASQRGEKQVKVLVKSPFQCVNHDPCLSLRELARMQSCSTCLPVCSIFLGRLSFVKVTATRCFVANVLCWR